MQQHNVEPTLRCRDIRKDCFEVGVTAKQEQIERATAAGIRARINSHAAPAVIHPLKILEEVRVGRDPFCGVQKWVGIPIEILAHCFSELVEIEAGEVANQAMSGKDG